MKYLNYLIYIFLFSLVLISCKEEDSDGDGVVDSKDICLSTPVGEKVDINGCSTSQLADDDDDGIPNWAECGEENVVFSKREIIFRFPKNDVERLKGLENDKSKMINTFIKILKKYYGLEPSYDTILKELIASIVDIEFCACGDLSPVLVKLSSDFPIEIETKLDNLKEETAEGGVEGDLNFNFTILPNETPNEIAGFNILGQVEHFKSTKAKFISGSSNVIAVLDTGVDLIGQYSTVQSPNEETRFIYENDEFDSLGECLGRYGGSGWNFANNNENFYDDNFGIGHGTLVTKTLTNELDLLGIKDYSILPLKVFDYRGRSSYWKINCAMAYLNEIQEKTKDADSRGDIKLINASFGGSFTALDPNDLGVMKSYIDSLGDSALFVSSAGNCGEDTDSTISHFPSGYKSKNIVSVGGYIMEGSSSIEKDIFSNYGTISIDVAAPFALDQLKVYIIGGNTGVRTMSTTKVEGTSFSTPLVSAKLFEIQLKNPDSKPEDVIREFFTDSHTEQAGNLGSFFKESRFYKPIQN